MRTATLGARAFIPVALVGAVLFTLAPSTATPASAAAPKTEAQQIIKIAKKQIGDPWRYGANGPKSFDCSGLVIYAFRKSGDIKFVANGKARSARALYKYFKARGLADRKNPKPGDLVIWGRGTHVGIYIGNGKAISTLTSGVKVHKVRAVRAKFTAYLHTGMWKKSIDGGSISLASQEDRTQGAHRPRRCPPHDRGRSTCGPPPACRTRGSPCCRAATTLVVTGKDQDASGRWWLQVRTGDPGRLGRQVADRELILDGRA